MKQKVYANIVNGIKTYFSTNPTPRVRAEKGIFNLGVGSMGGYYVVSRLMSEGEYLTAGLAGIVYLVCVVGGISDLKSTLNNYLRNRANQS